MGTGQLWSLLVPAGWGAMLGVPMRSRGCPWPTQSWGNAELQPHSGISSLRVLLPMLCLSFPWRVGVSAQQHQLIQGFGDRKTCPCEGDVPAAQCDATCPITPLSCGNTLPWKLWGWGSRESPWPSTGDQGGSVGGARGLLPHPVLRVLRVCSGTAGAGLGKGNRDEIPGFAGLLQSPFAPGPCSISPPAPP